MKRCGVRSNKARTLAIQQNSKSLPPRRARQFSDNVAAITATLAVAFSCLVTAVPLYAAGAAMGAWPSALAQASWGEIVFQGVYQGGVTMLIAGVAFTHVVNTFGPLRTVMITALVPVIAALAAVPLLGEPLTATLIVGLVCVTAGLLFGLRAAQPARSVAEPA